MPPTLVLQAGVTTQVDCETACKNSRTCHAAEFTTGDSTCRLVAETALLRGEVSATLAVCVIAGNKLLYEKTYTEGVGKCTLQDRTPPDV